MGDVHAMGAQDATSGTPVDPSVQFKRGQTLGEPPNTEAAKAKEAKGTQPQDASGASS